jgi:alpha 1,2-mannosyltransferase
VLILDASVLFTFTSFRRTSQIVSGNVSYGVIPDEHWKQPDWVDEDRARDGRNRLMAQNIIYGGMSPNPCRGHTFIADG